MTDQQISKLAGQLVVHQHLFSSLSNSERQLVILEPKKAIPFMVAGIKNRNSHGTKSGKAKTKQRKAYSLLESVTPIAPAFEGQFVAADTIFAPKSSNKIKVYDWGSNFTSYFKTKIDEFISDATVVPLRLKQSDTDSNIIADLGGKEAAETSLSDLWKKLLAQPNGQPGELLTNGFWNIFYIKDVTGELRAVRVYWGSGGWRLYAFPLDSFRWHAGYRVFVRNS
jgi:hypothetical protein